MANNHGNTPAAWTANGLAMVGFVIGSIGMLNNPVNLTLLYVGIALAVVALPLFLVMRKMGLNEERSH